MIDLETYLNEAPSAWKENRKFAGYLINRLQPNVVLDLGVDWGHSTLYWAEHGVGKVYGVDIWQPHDVCTAGKNFDKHVLPAFKSFHKQGMTNIELIKGDHRKVYETWTQPIDILHFDIAHTYDGIVKEYNLWRDKLHDKSVCVFHDLLSFPDGVGRFFRDYLSTPRVSFNNQFGLGVMTTDTDLLDDISQNFNVNKLDY